jgi:Apea-like HEPN
MSWGFQVLVQLPDTRRLSGEPQQTWSLPAPVGDVRLVATSPAADLTESSELAFYGSGYPSGAEAGASGELFQNWLRVASALNNLGFDLGDGKLLSWLSDAMKESLIQDPANEGLLVTDDIHGLYIFEETGKPSRFGMRATLTVSQTSSKAYDITKEVASRGHVLSAGMALACDLVSLSEFEGSNRMKFLLIVTAMEALAERADRTGQPRQLIDEYIEEIGQRARSVDGQDFKSLLSAMKDLRQESISGSIRRLTEFARPGDGEARKFASRIYKCRSQLVHNGRTDESVDELFPIAEGLIHDMLRQLMLSSPTT